MVKLKERNKALQDKRENGLKEIEGLKEQLRLGKSPAQSSLYTHSSSATGDSYFFPVRKQPSHLVVSPGMMLVELKKTCDSIYKEFLAIIPFGDEENKVLFQKMIRVERGINDIIMKVQEFQETFYE